MEIEQMKKEWKELIKLLQNNVYTTDKLNSKILEINGLLKDD